MKELQIIKIATRKSKLALVQAELVKNRLMAVFPAIAVEIIPMSTTGDENTDRSLSEIGGKGLFTKELEEELLSGTFDIAVHSLKDMETKLPQGLVISSVLEREDPRDALIASEGKTIATLEKGARVGTSSMRRSAQLKIIRPDLEIMPFRGNVTTRIEKLKKGEVVATLLAVAGLKRLGMENEATEILDTENFIPAVGQGIIAIECREDNYDLRAMLAGINHAPTLYASIAERSMLARLDGSCRTPIAGYARFEDGKLRLDAMVANLDGTRHVKATKTGDAEKAQAMGEELAEELLANGGRECLTK